MTIPVVRWRHSPVGRPLRQVIVLFLDVEVGCRLRTVVPEVVRIPIDWMSRPIEADRLLFIIELLDLGPRRNVRQLHMARYGAPDLVHAEEVRLSEVLVTLRSCAVLTSPVDRGEQTRTKRAERQLAPVIWPAGCSKPGSSSIRQRVAGARFDQRFEDTPVG